MCIRDSLHALTLDSNLETLNESVYEVTAAIIASGIDPQKSIIFNQSSVKEHSELCWIHIRIIYWAT